MVKLELAVKAPLVAYPAVILAELGNHLTPESPVEFSVIDEKEVAPGKVASFDGKPVDTPEAVKAVQNLFASKGLKLEIDSKWAEVAFGPLQGKNFKEIMPHLDQIEQFLNFRSFFQADSVVPGATDAVVWGALRANAVVGASCKNGSYINLARWYKLLDAHPLFGGVIATVQEQIKEVRHQQKVTTTRKKESKASFDIDLIDAEDGKVVTRFPPEPSGFMHIGHAKAAILNEYFARLYHGKLIVRFDDTNPSKEKEEYTESILKDISLLGIKPDVITYSSDYFDHMYKLAVQMIKDGLAYCDDTPQELMREQRGEGIPSARRDRTVEENLRVFDEMKKGSEEGLKHCLRAKISVDDNNKTLRDPVVYRCNLTPHVRTGSTWKMYPTYDFCSPVVDAVEGVTHALRTNEYRDRNAQYAWMLKALKLRNVHIWDFSRINFVRTVLSKRKLQWFVDTGRVSGWDDPRFPTVSGVRRRGMSVEGLRQFILSQGPSRNILNLDWSLIWNANKKVIDPIAPRYVAIEHPTKFTLTDNIQCHLEERALHKKNPDVGKKQIWLWNKLLIEQEDAQTLKEGEECTLMDWGNVIIDKIEGDGETVTHITGHLHLEGDFKKTEHKITWLAETPDLAKVELQQFDHLITKDKLEEDDKLEDNLTPQTVFVSEAVADHNVAKLPVGEVLQFERKGYYRVDTAASDGKKAVLFGVPDGKVVSRYGAKK